MSVFASIDKSVVKPVATALFVAAGEKYIFGNNDLKSIGMYAGAVGASSFAASLIGPYAPDLGIPASPMFDPKSAEQRVLELSLGVGAAYGVNKYALGNSFNFGAPETLKRIGVLVGAEVLGEYVSQYIDGQPLDYFTD